MSKEYMQYCPEVVVWELTYKCNAKCIHCGSDCTSVEKPYELSTRECIDIIKDLSYLGTEYVTLSGGEPLLRKDLKDIGHALNVENIKFGIISNGLALDENTIEIVKSIKPLVFSLSIDAGVAYLHDYIRGHKGTFAHLIKAIKLLQDNNINISVVTTVHKLNFPQLPKIRDLLIDLGIKVWQIQYADYIGRMSLDTMLTEAQFYQIARFISDLQTNYTKEFEYVTGADVTGYMSDFAQKIQGNWQGCHAGLRCLGIGSDGSVRGCLSLQRECYIEDYTTNRPLRKIWKDENCFSYNRKFDISSLTGYCKTCPHGKDCKGGCIRTATSNQFERCCKYCLYKIETSGFSSTKTEQIEFSKDEIAKLYNKISPLPQEFYSDELNFDILN